MGDHEMLGNRVYQSISASTLHGKRHVGETLKVLEQTYTSGLDKGDFELAGYALVVKCYNLFFLGRELSKVKQAILQAICTLDDCTIRTLLVDVPEAHTAMVDAISKLLKEYRYDTLMSILEIKP
ncbi:hypothetical protein [Acaryochloris sp. CCMEE 5410]|uniref:hypothetical protein n=1 Tax=Acaryochloris sp. CCMEE 5410 TaxID=310037 RepID=UPI001111E780|nr:hypothetical protein [Acaryochloris sp. CCMEE 5410]